MVPNLRELFFSLVLLRVFRMGANFAPSIIEIATVMTMKKLATKKTQ